MTTVAAVDLLADREDVIIDDSEQLDVKPVAHHDEEVGLVFLQTDDLAQSRSCVANNLLSRSSCSSDT